MLQRPELDTKAHYVHGSRVCDSGASGVRYFLFGHSSGDQIYREPGIKAAVAAGV